LFWIGACAEQAVTLNHFRDTYNAVLCTASALDAKFSPRSARYSPTAVNLRIVVEKETLGQGFLHVLLFLPPTHSSIYW
jgi:hypothetical protein